MVDVVDRRVYDAAGLGYEQQSRHEGEDPGGHLHRSWEAEADGADTVSTPGRRWDDRDTMAGAHVIKTGYCSWPAEQVPGSHTVKSTLRWAVNRLPVPDGPCAFYHPPRTSDAVGGAARSKITVGGFPDDDGEENNPPPRQMTTRS